MTWPAGRDVSMPAGSRLAGICVTSDGSAIVYATSTEPPPPDVAAAAT